MKRLRAFWLRRGIATRLTALMALMLALVCALWTWFAWTKAANEVSNNAYYRAKNNYENIMAVLEHKQYDFAHMPYPNTPEYYRLKSDLYEVHADSPYSIRYFTNNETVVVNSAWCVKGLLHYDEPVGYEEGITVDISDFSADEIQSFYDYLETQDITHDMPLRNPLLTVYGVLDDTVSPHLFYPNRIETQDGQQVWRAERPVTEQDTCRFYYQDSFAGSDYQQHLDAMRWVQARQRGVSNLELEDLAHHNFAANTWANRYIVIQYTYVYDYYDDISDYFRSFPMMVFILCLLLLYLFYKGVRRAVVYPLYDTTRQAQHVAHLEFDQFHPDTARGDEIGDLNRALSDMAGDLHARWDSERDLEDRRQQFVAAASHDLKTPLALIGGYAEAIAQDISPEENARYLAAIEQETGRMNALVREMLDYTRLDRTDELQNRKTVDLTALTRSLLEEYAPLFENRRLTCDIMDGVRIRGDETLLRRAFGCLLENAAKYSPDDGRVAVVLRQGGGIFEVANDCDPIPADELPRLFEMFYRGDKARNRAGGHGLGLAITRKILALHGLAVCAEGTETGVRFVVRKK